MGGNKLPPVSVTYLVLLIPHLYLLTVADGLPVTETATSRETDGKQTGEPAFEMNTLTIETGEADPLHSSDEFKPFQPSSTFSRTLGDDRNRNDSNDDELSKDDVQFQPCKMQNVTYQHREQIPRSDPCEMCVCVDSEMYCFWKLCGFHKSTTVSTPISPSLFPSSPSSEDVSDKKNESTDEEENFIINKLKVENENSNEIVATNEKYSKILTDERKFNILKKLVPPPTTTTTAATTTTSSTASSETSSTKNPVTVATTTTEPIVCYVMGVMYKYGEVLPKDTGTCLECACSDGGRVTCSPKDCVSQPDLDYLSHNNNMDLFDIDTF